MFPKSRGPLFFEFLPILASAHESRDGNRSFIIVNAAFVEVSNQGRHTLVPAPPRMYELGEFSYSGALTLAVSQGTLVLSCRKSQLAPLPSRPRTSMRPLNRPSRKFCLSRTRLSRRNSTARSECGDSGRNGLPPTLPAQRVRKPFRPPCQSPQQRLTASPRSAIKLIQISASLSAACCPHPCDC